VRRKRVKHLVSVVTVLAVLGVVTAGWARSSSSDQGTTASATSTGTVASAGDAANGKKIFTQNCASCHGATGTEGGAGPSLKGEKSRQDTAAAVAWIKDPKPPMPKLYPTPLSDKDVADVAAYVETL
jgi:mono/diheme cytochrome c family protein